MNENKWIDNPWITIIILITKTTMVVNFNLQNFIDWLVLTEEIFQVNCKSWVVANLPVVDFHSQPREMVTSKPLNVQLSVFFLVYWFPSPSKKVWTLQSVSDTHILVFYRHNSRKLPQKNLYWESRRLCRSFINLIEWRQWQVRLICCINTRERIRYFFTCVFTAFLRAANPCITPQFMW